MTVGLIVRRNPDESWRECVQRVAGKQGLEIECLANFDDYVAAGREQDRAAWMALYDWDCLDLAVE